MYTRVLSSVLSSYPKNSCRKRWFPSLKFINNRKYFHEFIPKLTSYEVNRNLLDAVVSGNSEGCLAYLEYYKELVDFSRKSSNGNRLIDWAIQSAHPNSSRHNQEGQYLQIIAYFLLQGEITKKIPEDRLILSESTREGILKPFIEFVDEFPRTLQKAKYLDYSDLPVEFDVPLSNYALNLIQLWHKPRVFEKIQLKKLVNNADDEVRVLSLGCGPIDEFLPLSDLFPNIKYFGIDQDKLTIELCRKVYQNSPVQPILKLGDFTKLENLLELGLDKKSFDLIMIFHPDFGPVGAGAFDHVIKHIVPQLLKTDGTFVSTNYWLEESEFMKMQFPNLYPYSASYSNLNDYFHFSGPEGGAAQFSDNFIFLGSNEEKPTLKKQNKEKTINENTMHNACRF